MVNDTIPTGGVGDEAKTPFEQALVAYQKGGSVEELLPTFLDIVRNSPNHGPAWTCLCWLQLLASRPLAALRSGRVAVRLNPQDPQARLNLSLAMLDTNTKGVREQIQQIQKVLTMAPELKEEIHQSIVDGLERRGDWQALRKVKTWLFPSRDR
ncbi:MAG: hypothetical protein TH68_00150 [Candidatus Synechococcus spongiarum 142]|uniref:TPR-repeat protein, specific for cyanobacteria n=1 Tax=Candidatus Synechococcus spongiarum 142 TaxID=1608213 RepID=A0A6N3XDQ8_9SYNE|nr:MAG: hypothetical protein TH68_00150 [Candidatus Synechococcus spongiarum 142]